MPASQVKILKNAFTEFRKATDAHDLWANSRLAIVIKAADAAGWSRRSITAALGLGRERLLRIASFQASGTYPMPQYTPGAPFPAAAVAIFRRHENEVSLRRIRTERELIALVRAAHDAGWPYDTLGALVGGGGERLRQLAEIDLDVSHEQVPVFDDFVRALKGITEPRPKVLPTEAETERLRELADRAWKTTRAVGTRSAATRRPRDVRALEVHLADRLASEELSALIIALKRSNVPWHALDTACGYKPGTARARAIRHGYSKTPPTVRPYTPTPLDGWPAPAPSLI